MQCGHAAAAANWTPPSEKLDRFPRGRVPQRRDRAACRRKELSDGRYIPPKAVRKKPQGNFSL